MAMRPTRMSMIEPQVPYHTGLPGLASWMMQMPLTTSAVCWARRPARVTGEVAPACGSLVTSMGRPHLANSRAPSIWSRSWCRGDTGLSVVKVYGFFFSSDSPPAITATMRRQSSAMPRSREVALTGLEELRTLS